MESELPNDLLTRAALLEWFDEPTLLTLLPDAGAAIAILLASHLVVGFADRPDSFALREAVRAAILSRLRSEPRAELRLRRELFDTFLGLLATEHSIDRERDEDHCFGQLARLFVLHYLRFEWQAIDNLVDALHVAPPRKLAYQRRLQLYRAFVAVRIGDYAIGKRLLDELLAASDLEPQVRLEGVQALGHMRRFQMQYDRAIQTYEELGHLALAAKMPVYYGVALFNLGAVQNELENYELALEYVSQSEQLFATYDDQERLAYARYCIGLNAMYLGRWEYAREQYAGASVLFERYAMDTTLATSLWGQGLLTLLLGDFAESERLHREALQRNNASGRGDVHLALDIWLDLGYLGFTQARHDEALACYAEAAALATQLGHEHRVSLIHSHRARALQAMGRDDEARAAYGSAMDAVDALRGAHTKEDVKISVLGTTQQVYEAAALFAVERGRAAEAFAVVERACSRAFLDSLAARDAELAGALAQQTVALEEVQAALPPGALLLAYYTTGVLPTGEHFFHKIPPENKALLEHLLLPAGVVLFAITRDGCTLHRLALDPNSLRPTAGDPRPGRHLVRERILAALYERLIGPVASLMATCTSLFIVPHGPLHSVPFMALRSRDGQHLVRAGGPAVALAPSTTFLVRSCLGRPPSPASGSLAIGYNGAGDAALRFAEPEARLVAAMLGGRAIAGEEARAAAVAAAAPGLRTLHIAGHAAFRADDPLESSLALAGGDRLSARAIMGEVRLNADLVVLSACTSGLSHVVPGDELLGLQRAWLYAGAAAVVCALWEAPDLVTLLVMERFYAALAAGAGPGAALRDALVAVRTLTGRELRRIFDRWRAADPGLAAPDALPVVPPELDDAAIYADPIVWAPFMLIGRP